MKKLIKKTIIFGALLLTLYLIGHPLQSHLAYKVYPKLPINLGSSVKLDERPPFYRISLFYRTLTVSWRIKMVTVRK